MNIKGKSKVRITGVALLVVILASVGSYLDVEEIRKVTIIYQTMQ